MANGGKSDGPLADRSRPLLDEIQNALEELLAAESELRRQDGDLRAAIAAAEAEGTRYRELFELMPSGYLVLDRKGTILDANHAAQALLGHPASELAGRPFLALVASDTKPLREAIAEARQGQRNRFEEIEIELRRRDGPPLPAALTLAVARDDRGRMVGMRALLLDLRERKRAEEAARVASEAHAADAAKDEFLATLSHELRTPLSAILGWAQILRSEAVPEETSSALQSIERNSRHLSRLVNDLLDVSQIGRAEIALDLQPCEPGQVAADAIDAVWPALAARHLRLHLTMGVHRPMLADPPRLRQALVNLLANSVKFSPRGGIVRLAMTCEERELRIAVGDSGSGIEPSLLPYVFDRFRQGHATPERPTEGLGLGLAIVREVVAHHGGKVAAESDGPGRGATFRFAIPLVPPALVAPREAPSVKAAAADRPLRGLRFLALATPRTSPNGLPATLASAGAEVARAHSVSDAIDCARAFRPDAIVVDARPREESSLVPVAKAVAACFAGDLPLVISAPRHGASHGWQDLDVSLQIHVPARPEASAIIPVVGTLARLRGARLASAGN